MTGNFDKKRAVLYEKEQKLFLLTNEVAGSRI